MQFNNIKLDSFIFPKAYLSLDDDIYGIFMDYADGYTLFEKVQNKQDINILGNHLEKLVKDTHSISKY